MQIAILIQVINYLKDISGDSALLEGYRNLSKVIKDSSIKNENDFSEISKEKERLHKLLIDSDPSDWGFEAYRLFEQINKNRLFGKSAADYIDNLIIEENKDNQAICSDLDKKIKHISKLSDSLTRFQQLFEQLVAAESFQIIDDTVSKPSINLYFERHLSVRYIADLERYTRLWDGILGTFVKLTGEENLSLVNSSFNNGIFILGVAIDEKTLNAFITGTSEILKTLSLILNIRKIQVEINKLPLVYNLNELLEEEIKTLISQSALGTAQNLVSQYYNNDSYTDEISSEISHSLKQILSFVEKGGKIECRPLKQGQDVVALNNSLNEFSSIARDLESLSDSLGGSVAEAGELSKEERTEEVLSESVL